MNNQSCRSLECFFLRTQVNEGAHIADEKTHVGEEGAQPKADEPIMCVVALSKSEPNSMK
jgi:hypothetical protein